MKDFEGITYLSVLLRDDSTLAVVDTPTVRFHLDAAIEDRDVNPVYLYLVFGGSIKVKAKHIGGYGASTPETRAAHRAFNKALEEEAKEPEEWES